MSEIITVFRESDLPAECSKIEVKSHYGYNNGFSFEIFCVHCKIKSDTPQLITLAGKVLCPNCQQEL